MLAELHETIEKLMGSQTGFSLGLIVGVATSMIAQRIWLIRFISKLDEATEAQDRLTRVVSASLMDSSISTIKNIGMEAIAQINAKEAQHK